MAVQSTESGDCEVPQGNPAIGRSDKFSQLTQISGCARKSWLVSSALRYSEDFVSYITLLISVLGICFCDANMARNL